MDSILFAKYAPIWGFAACISSLVLFYGLAFTFVGKNKQATNVAVALLVVTAFFIPLYCAGLSVYFLFCGKPRGEFWDCKTIRAGASCS